MEGLTVKFTFKKNSNIDQNYALLCFVALKVFYLYFFPKNVNLKIMNYFCHKLLEYKIH